MDEQKKEEPIIEEKVEEKQPEPVQEAPAVEKPVEPKPIEPEIEEKEPKEEEKEEKEDVEELIPKEPYQSSPLFYQVANYFKLEPQVYENVKDRLSVITDWAITTTKSNNINTVMHAIENLENLIPKPTWGESRHANLYRYIRLLSTGNK